MPPRSSRPFDVPVVDIASYVGTGGDPAERARVAAAVDDACRTVGFLQVTGHGIGADVISGLTAAIDGFFDLPLPTKQAYRSPPEINRGYSPPRSEALSLSLGVEQSPDDLDYFEAFNVGATASEYGDPRLPESVYPANLWPSEVPSMRDGIETYFAEARRVAHTLTAVFAEALGLRGDFFETHTTHSVDVLRLVHYDLPAGTPVTAAEPTGMGAHSDFGIVTVLWADPVPGLQVLDGGGRWHDVVPAEGALLVNLGDLTARWTNDRWLSTLHRVVPPIVDGTIERRRSAAFFHDGNVDAVVETLPTCLDGAAVSPYPPITVGDHLAAKLAGSRAGRPNAAGEREAARVRAAGSSAQRSS